MIRRRPIRATQRGLELFRCHPLVDHLFRLKYARDYFRDEAERIHAGGAPIAETCGYEWHCEAMRYAEQRMTDIADRLRINGEPLIEAWL